MAGNDYTTKQRRKAADQRKREAGLYKATVWIHTENKAELSRLVQYLEKPAEVTEDRRGGEPRAIVKARKQ